MRVKILTACLVFGCGRAQPGDANRPGAPSDTLVAEFVATIGEIDGAPEYLFGDVASVSFGPGDVVYVADRFGSTVRAYDLSGQFLATIGSEGEGPGEFLVPNDLTFDLDGRLYVRELSRITVLGPTGGGVLRDSVIRTIQLGRFNIESTRGKTDGVSYYAPGYYYFMFERHRFFYMVVDTMGPTGDTIPVWLPNPQAQSPATYLVDGGSTGLMVEGINLAPFEPRPSWDITVQGTVFMTRGDRYRIVELEPTGDTMRVIELASEPRLVPRSVLRDSSRAFQSRLDSVPVPLDQVRGMSESARSGRWPDVLPEITALHVAADGSIWLRRWPGVDQRRQTAFDVLDASGRPRRTVLVPATLMADPPPFVSEERVIGVVQDPVTEVERVVVFSIPRF